MFVTSRGHPYAELQRALKNGNVWVAEPVARDLRHVWLEDALKLTRLYAGEGAVGEVRAGRAEVAAPLPGRKEPTLNNFRRSSAASRSASSRRPGETDCRAGTDNIHACPIALRSVWNSRQLPSAVTRA